MKRKINKENRSGIHEKGEEMKEPTQNTHGNGAHHTSIITTDGRSTYMRTYKPVYRLGRRASVQHGRAAKAAELGQCEYIGLGCYNVWKC